MDTCGDCAYWLPNLPYAWGKCGVPIPMWVDVDHNEAPIIYVRDASECDCFLRLIKDGKDDE
jgi:hypothetical protein